MLKHLDLEGAAPGELIQRTETAGPLAILDEYYGVYTTMPDDAQCRLNLMEEHYFDYVENENIYPPLFMDAEDAERIAVIESDLLPYTYQKRAEWIIGGVTDQEWDDYLDELERLNLSEYLEIKQKYYDDYIEGVDE